MAKEVFISALRAGTIAGLGLATFLWGMQLASGRNVFVLLLNVDFVPVVGSISWPFWAEMIFHLIISWAIAFIYMFYVKIETRTSRKKWMMAGILSGLAGLTYFPLVMLAEKAVPPVDDMIAVALWFAGHGIYAVLLKITTD